MSKTCGLGWREERSNKEPLDILGAEIGGRTSREFSLAALPHRGLRKGKLMTKSSLSLLVFGIYLIGMGAGLVVMPNLILGILGLPLTNEIWIHVLGVVVLALAFYYLQAARANLRSFAEWSIPPRVAVFLFFTGFVLVGWVGPILIGLGAVDLLGAVWTGWALRAEKEPLSG